MTEATKGLRSRQKEMRHRQILDASARLFAEKGFEATTIDEIAAMSLTSVPTVYKYFAAKNDILFALFEAEERSVEPLVRKMLKSLPSDPVDALVKIEMLVLCDGFDRTKKRVWREISAAGVRADGIQRTHFVSLQKLQMEWLENAFEVMKSKGTVKADLDCGRAARMIYGVARNNFLIFVVNDEMSEGELERELRADFEIATKGFLPLLLAQEHST